MSAILNLFRRKKKAPPLACMMSLDDTTHIHTDACFIDLQPLAVVELFQSQGCQSCPPAIPKIHEGVKDPNLVLLTYNVTYFNHTGWTDTFASTQWDQRQRTYIKKWGKNTLYTPQVVADGVTDGTGSRDGEVQEIVRRGRDMRHQMTKWHVNLELNEAGIRIDSDLSEAETHDVIVIRYDPKEQVVKVGKGANKGKKIKHLNMVKQLMKVGEWKGGNLEIPLPKMEHDGLQTVAILQAGMGGAIMAAQRL